MTDRCVSAFTSQWAREMKTWLFIYCPAVRTNTRSYVVAHITGRIRSSVTADRPRAASASAVITLTVAVGRSLILPIWHQPGISAWNFVDQLVNQRLCIPLYVACASETDHPYSWNNAMFKCSDTASETVLLSSAKRGLYAKMLSKVSICVSVCSFVHSFVCRLCHVAAAIKGVPYVSFPWETPREIYGCGGGLIVASINVPHSFSSVRTFRIVQVLVRNRKGVYVTSY